MIRFLHLRQALTGSAVFLAALAAPHLTAQEKPDEVTLCAYNLRNWLVMDRFDGQKLVPGAAKPESECQKVVEFLLDIRPGILGVCEIGTRADLADLQARLKKSGLDLPHIEFNQGGDTTRSLALLSRYPIVARNSQSALKYEIGKLTLPMQRGILDATVEVTPGFRLQMLGVHLKSMREIPEADQALMRRNEAHLLRKHVDAIIQRDPAARIVCYGDFNEHRNEPAIAEIIGSRASDGWLTEVPLADANNEVWTHFWDTADSYARLDYFFISRTLRPHRLPGKSRVFMDRDFLQASDHRPIVLTLSTEINLNRAKKK